MENIAGTVSPYLVVLLIGFLPSEIWRLLGALLSRGLAEDSEVLIWVRTIATSLLAAVVAKLLLTPSGALADLSLASRLVSLAIGLAGYFLLRRSVLAAIILGEISLVFLATFHNL